MKAIKEKVPYRVLFHDQSAAMPNRVEVQRLQSGSFVTIPRGTHSLSEGVAILTGGLGSMTVGGRDECTPGKVAVQGRPSTPDVISIASTCHTSLN